MQAFVLKGELGMVLMVEKKHLSNNRVNDIVEAQHYGTPSESELRFMKGFQENESFVLKNDSTGSSTSVIWCRQKQFRFALLQDVFGTEVLRESGVYEQSFAEQASFYRHQEKIIERPMIYNSLRLLISGMNWNYWTLKASVIEYEEFY